MRSLFVTLPSSLRVPCMVQPPKAPPYLHNPARIKRKIAYLAVRSSVTPLTVLAKFSSEGVGNFPDGDCGFHAFHDPREQVLGTSGGGPKSPNCLGRALPIALFP